MCPLNYIYTNPSKKKLITNHHPPPVSAYLKLSPNLCTMTVPPITPFPSRLIIIAGTYDGVLAGWDTLSHEREADAHDIDMKLLRKNDGAHLKLSFAMPAHEGSVRCLDIASAAAIIEKYDKKRPHSDDEAEIMHEPGSLLSGGFDETINIFNLQKHSQAGELKTPNDLGSPLCCSFAPPSQSATTAPPTHALVGLTSGKIVLYKKRDWSVQHVLSGHDDGGVQCLAVHPTGRMALSGGRDGKIVLWDLMKGRLAFVYKISALKKIKRKESVNHIVWSGDGNRYAFCYGSKITARDVASGEDLLDVEMPSRVNQLAFIGGAEGMFLAAACDDGGLPVLEVGQLEEEGDANTRRAIMAIEPVDRVVAGDDRLKCIQAIEGGSGFLVVTANSGGIVSVMDLEGAARMMLTPSNGGDSEGETDSDDAGNDTDSDGEMEVAVEILDSVRLGSGARIINLTAWSYAGENDIDDSDDEEESLSESESASDPETEKSKKEPETNTPEGTKGVKIELDADALEKARKLVGQAKKHQQKKKKRLSEKKSK